MVFTGTLANVNTALAGLADFLGTQDFSGSATLTLTIDDQGHGGGPQDRHRHGGDHHQRGQRRPGQHRAGGPVDQ